ncbi:oxidoreductase [Mycobacterium sp. MS1601]|uniref:aldo/keto reductase n=1 Tax=Mycobacterium sp. MS1601 TaxID=1936029 RepID=UPI00097953BB|nr:aldo/keto reductase [Mycobacterium sp. MS1601]AQA06360.1 oxidoreductase [Mycobacterium sp. MS1601]
MIPTRAIPPASGAKHADLGQGTWHFAENTALRSEEVASIRLGIDLGMTVIDTAEMYGNGAAEALVGEAIAGQRNKVFLVDKVLPHHATREGTFRACEASLRRLGVDHIDLYVLHWRGAIPLSDTIEGFTDLKRRGMIRHWGVSNFDIDDVVELLAVTGGVGVQANQILYNLTRRGPEYALLPWLAQQGIAAMAYSPIEQGRLLRHPALQRIAQRHNATPAQVALAWVHRHGGVTAIPRARRLSHVRQNAAARDIELTHVDLGDLDQAFPPPTKPHPLEVL